LIADFHTRKLDFNFVVTEAALLFAAFQYLGCQMVSQLLAGVLVGIAHGLGSEL
jgi:hypothetical protein